MAKFPIPAFNFRVTIEGMSMECSEVTGLKGTMEYQEVRSGTQSNYHFKIPTKMTYGDITFKRGVIREASKQFFSLTKSKSNFNNRIPFAKQWSDITIELLSEAEKIVCSWTLINPYILSWEFSNLNASSNELMFETLTFNCIEIQLNFK